MKYNFTFFIYLAGAAAPGAGWLNAPKAWFWNVANELDSLGFIPLAQ
jgi:hypothetical protein